VAVLDVDAAAVRKAETKLDAAHAACVDVRDAVAFRAAIDEVEAALGPVAVMVNNAGVMPLGRLDAEADSTTARVLDINTVGVITGTKQALETMLPRRRGHIINVASVAGQRGVPGGATYSASKAAVIAFTDVVRLEVRDRCVDCTVVQPLFARTELIAGTKPSRPVRVIEPEEVAAAVVRVLDRQRPHVVVPPASVASCGSSRSSREGRSRGYTDASGRRRSSWAGSTPPPGLTTSRVRGAEPSGARRPERPPAKPAGPTHQLTARCRPSQ
jgi:NADP-dependent 3-hydroxy acid dehydrogenase YdfG